ncbi:MAG: Cna protein B-type domain protein, partial [Sphingomonadales bacterium]|nr:Cna protein B-type domain protein [Sphingomonadales bacterium]
MQRRLFQLVCLLLVAGLTWAQNVTVTGKVTDEAGNPLA